MKKLLPLLFIFLAQFSFAQPEAIGSKEYGRIQFLTYDPVIQNKIYAATQGNHVVVSEDNGLTWNVLYSFPTNHFGLIYNMELHSNTELAFSVSTEDSSNNNKIYILNMATGQITREYTIPIPSDADAGSGGISNWDFYNPDTALVILNYSAGGPRARVYYTKDGGNIWTMIYFNMDHETIFPQNVAISPDNSEKFFIARHAGFNAEHTGGLYISENAGQTWTEKYPNVDFGAMAFHPNNPDDILLGSWAYSATQDLYRSLDGGDNWSVVDPNWATDVISNGTLDIQYNPSDSNNIIVTGTNSIVRTYDNFLTKEVFNFENQIENPNNYYFGFRASFNPFNTQEILITNNDFPLRSTDGGATVSKVENPYFFSLLGQLSLFENGTDKHLYYSVQNGYSHRNLTTQAESPYGTLPVQSLPFTNNKFYSDEHHQGRIYGYFESFGGSGLGVSNDHGENVIGIPSPYVFMHAVASRPDNANILFCSLSNDYDYSELVQFDITDTDNIQQTTIPLPASRLLRDFHFDLGDPSLLWISVGKYIYKTPDYGVTWIMQSNGLESLNSFDKIYQITQNPLALNQFTIATTEGIFTSIDSGENWMQLLTDEVQTVKHSDFNANHMVAITHDTQYTYFTVRYSNDAGATWYQVPMEALLYITDDIGSGDIDFNGNNAEVYIGTYDLGVIKYTIDMTTLANVSFKSNKNYQVYPNPSGGMVFIKSPQGLNNFSLTLYDNLGKKINEAENTDRIDLKDYNAGMYFLKVQSANGAVETHKILKP